MKLLKNIVLVSLSLMLFACGGHGYEGTYQSSVDSKMMNQYMNKMPQSKMTIGSGFIESNGSRTEVDEIFVRESDGKEYLIIKMGNQEQVLEIIDEGTLQQDMGMMKIKFKRI